MIILVAQAWCCARDLLAKLHRVWWQLLKQQLPAFMPTNGDRALPVLAFQFFYTLICVLCCTHHFASDVTVNLLMNQYTLRGKPTWAYMHDLMSRRSDATENMLIEISYTA